MHNKKINPTAKSAAAYLKRYVNTMHSQITDKMKEALLNSLPKRYEISKSLSPILEHDFYSADSWFLDNVPMLRIPNAPQHSLQPTLNHLERGGYIVSNKAKMSFRLTKKGYKHINPVQPKPNTNRDANWQNNIFVYIVVGVVVIILGGLSLHYLNLT